MSMSDYEGKAMFLEMRALELIDEGRYVDADMMRDAAFAIRDLLPPIPRLHTSASTP